MSLMGCANEQAGRACDCDDCTGTEWGPTSQPPVSAETLRMLEDVAKSLGKAARVGMDVMILDAIR
jgi:hypothetical protein